jgi:magnesium transporter
VVEGLSDVDQILNLLAPFTVEPLIVEDIFHVNQRTKIERGDTYRFIVVKYSYLESDTIHHDCISMLVFDQVLFCFTEHQNRFLDVLRTRLSQAQSKLRKLGQDYLFYALFDLIVDDALRVNTMVMDQLDDLETALLDLDEQDQLRLYDIRKELVFLKSMSLQLLNNIPEDTFTDWSLFTKGVLRYLGDVYDHIEILRVQALSSLEQVSHMLDVYMNQVSNRMNQIMTTLTIFSAIFIPLSFVAGVFGMNFIDFPILQDPNGMLYFGLICLLIPIGMVLFFKWRKWF